MKLIRENPLFVSVILMYVVASALIAIDLLAAQDRTPPHPSLRVVGISIVPHREMGGRFTSFAVTAVVQSVEHLPSGEVVVKESRIVNYDMMAGAPETVDVSGHSRKYSDIAASMYAAALQEYEQAQEKPDSPPPLPAVDRRAMREPAK